MTRLKQGPAARVPGTLQHGAGFRGNKATLPSKPCLACGRVMGWRRAWAKNWDEVRYCSSACRRHKATRG